MCWITAVGGEPETIKPLTQPHINWIIAVSVVVPVVRIREVLVDMRHRLVPVRVAMFAARHHH